MVKIYLFTLFSFLMLATSCVTSSVSTNSGKEETISGAHNIRWVSSYNTLKDVSVNWNSFAPNDSIRWGYSGDYEFGVFSGTQTQSSGKFMYEFSFPNLKPSSQIYYSLKSNGEWTDDKVFSTSVDTSSNNFSFIVGGDSKCGYNDNYDNGWKRMSELISSEKFDFFIHLGDITYKDDKPSQWDTYFQYGANLIENNLIFYTWGNHEYGPLALSTIKMPGNNKWYSFVQGNTLFISLLTEEDFDIQYEWLVEKLENSREQWIVVFFHRPFFTRGKHSDEMNDYRNTWWKAFDDYGVDLVLGGHTHSYIRSVPLNLNKSDTSAVDEYGNKPEQGRLEIVSGGLGGKSSKSEDWFAASAYSGLHYVKFEIEGNKLHFNAINDSGEMIDSLTLYSSGRVH